MIRINLYRFMTTVSKRIPHVNDEEIIISPIIRTYDKEQDEYILFNSLFKRVENVWNDIFILSKIWNELCPDKNQRDVSEKQFEIAQWIGGKRSVYDFLVCMKWINRRCDIPNYVLAQEIDTAEF